MKITRILQQLCVYLCLICWSLTANSTTTPPDLNSSQHLNNSSIYFFISDDRINDKEYLCSGPRVGPALVAITPHCHEKLQTQALAGKTIVAESKSGTQFGKVTIQTDRKQNDLTIHSAVTESHNMGDTPWFSIDQDDHSNERELLTLHFQKGSMVLGNTYCNDETCLIYDAAGEEVVYSDGTPVYNDNKLLCLMSQAGHCIRARSAALELTDLCLGWDWPYTKYASGRECENAGCPNANGTCCIYNQGPTKLLRCSHCSNPDNPNDCGPNTDTTYCHMSNNVNGGTCGCGLSGSINGMAPKVRRSCSHRIPGSEGLAPGNYIPMAIFGGLTFLGLSVCGVIACASSPCYSTGKDACAACSSGASKVIKNAGLIIYQVLEAFSRK